ncbi:hypothetical protein V8G54_028661 [Vigna mungo]|uniref:Uncharacterized protein n=1 Tax=Vigna mungo TaxID=3915 RepID=A0AAQ3MT30_VIGMU
MENNLLAKGSEKQKVTGDVLGEEIKKIIRIAGPMMGMASGSETICGHAYGAQSYKKFGEQTYSAIFSLTISNMEKILVSIGQDPLIAHEAGKFIIWLLPALFAYAIIGAIFLCHFMIPLCWAYVFFFDCTWDPACEKPRAPISMELFQGILDLNTICTLFAIPFGTSAAARTRKSTCCRVTVLVAISFVITEATIVSGTLFFPRRIFGYIFSNEKEVVDYVTAMAPLRHSASGIPVAASLAFLAKMRGKGHWIGV